MASAQEREAMARLIMYLDTARQKIELAGVALEQANVDTDTKAIIQSNITTAEAALNAARQSAQDEHVSRE